MACSPPVSSNSATLPQNETSTVSATAVFQVKGDNQYPFKLTTDPGTEKNLYFKEGSDLAFRLDGNETLGSDVGKSCSGPRGCWNSNSIEHNCLLSSSVPPTSAFTASAGFTPSMSLSCNATSPSNPVTQSGKEPNVK